MIPFSFVFPSRDADLDFIAFFPLPYMTLCAFFFILLVVTWNKIEIEQLLFWPFV